MQNEDHVKMTLTDIRIPFWRLVMVLVKVALASIPAAFILTFIYMFISMLAIGILGSLGMGLDVWSNLWEHAGPRMH